MTDQNQLLREALQDIEQAHDLSLDLDHYAGRQVLVSLADKIKVALAQPAEGGEAREFFAYHSDMGVEFFNGPDAEAAAKSLCDENLKLERAEAESTDEWADDRAESIRWGVVLGRAKFFEDLVQEGEDSGDYKMVGYTTPPASQERIEDLEKELADTVQSRDFYQRRCNLLQEWQSKLRDPERTIVCDILANGQTLPPEHAGDRYSVPASQELAKCVACEGNPAPGNNPCAVCGSSQAQQPSTQAWANETGLRQIECPSCGDLAVAYDPQQPSGEVVAWRTFDGEGGYEYRDFEGNENYADEWAKRNPQYKEWVEPLTRATPKPEPMTWQDVASCPDGDAWFSLSCGHVVIGFKHGGMMEWSSSADDCCFHSEAIKAIPLTRPAHHNITKEQA